MNSSVIRDFDYLVVGTWNAHGLRAKTLELEVFLTTQNISVMLISETMLSAGVSCKIQGFQIFRKDRITLGGGVAVLVKNGIQARQIDVVTGIEAVGVEIEIKGKRSRFISVYVPPSAKLLDADLRGLLVGGRTLIGGDFNAKNSSWGCRKTDARGKLLGKFVQEVRGLEVFAPADATLVNSNRRVINDILDIFLGYRMAAPWEVRTQVALNSDHFPVTARIGGDPAKAKARNKIDWGRFK
ncbi:TPA: hypothetical protein KWZ19_005116, partial [Escherichia coli]|nr:hypothetical protein [Escherichia coli]